MSDPQRIAAYLDEIARLASRVEELEAFAKAFGESSMYYPGCGCHICEKYRAAITQETRDE